MGPPACRRNAFGFFYSSRQRDRHRRQAAVKGAKASGTAADVSKLVLQMKHVLRYDNWPKEWIKEIREVPSR
jgi:hypothetical protein